MAPPEPPTTITLKVKVPPGYSSDGNDEFPLGSLAVNTTIGAVRQQIQSTIPSHPTPEQQRILYGGRALVDNEQTLADALNTKRDPTQTENDAQNGDGQGHRRVVSTPPAPDTQPPQQPGQQMPMPGQHVHPNVLHQQALARQMAMQQQQMLHQHMAHGQGMQPGMPPMQFPGMQMPMPPGFGQAVTQGQQQRAAMGMQGAGPQPMPTQQPQQGGDGQNERPTTDNASQAQGQRLPAAGSSPQQNPALHGQPHHHHHHHGRPVSGQGFHFQGVGPNGQQIQIHQQTLQFPGQPFPPGQPNGMPLFPHLFLPQAQQQQPAMPPPGPSALERARSNLTEMRTMLEQIRDTIRNGEHTDESLRTQTARVEELEARVREVREYIDPFGVAGNANLGAELFANAGVNASSLFGDAGRRSAPPPQQATPPGGGNLFDSGPPAQRNLFANANGQQGAGTGSALPAPGSLFGSNANAQTSLFGGLPSGPLFGRQMNGQPHNQRSLYDSVVGQAAPSGPDDTTCYLLSGPQGPQALLFTPQHGTYTGRMPAGLRPTPTVMPLQQQHLFPNATTLQHGPNGQLQQPAANNAVPGQPPAAQPNGQAIANADPAANPAQAQVAAQPNALGPLEPLLNHMWLLFRLLIFAYFIMGSNLGWRRPLALVMIGLGFWMVRAGMLGDGGVARRWWDGVVGGNAGAPAAGAQGQGGDQATGQGAAAQGPAGAMPTPQQVAQRLLDERNQAQNARVRRLREYIRPVERAVALFVASLWPGIGEAHVRAREEEERRRRDEAEVAERKRQEDERKAAEEREMESAEQKGRSKEREMERRKESDHDDHEERQGQVKDGDEGSSTGASNPQPVKEQIVDWE
ncbi:hypothetical protein LTR86_006349 [Recurvomyces mirabilis]|nr:hypothetical protein LTR86_006349 [Recurvomyces mirabilis]